MENLINNFHVIRNAVMRFLQIKFRGSNLLLTDIEDAFSTAYQKLLEDQRKSKPKLTPSEKTLRYLAYNALVDRYRKKKRETLLADFSYLPLSTTSNDITYMEKKEQIEAIIEQVQYLPMRWQDLMTAKYHAFEFTHLEEIIKCKNSPEKDFKQLGYPSDASMRLDKHRAIKSLRTRCL